MAGRKADDVRTISDLRRAVQSLARHFQTDTIVIVGSQAILLSWPQAPIRMRTSPEIDAYPANNKEWEARHPGAEASEEINALFGYGSHFHDEFGFFVDGVDERTASLPPGWQERCVILEWQDHGVTIRAMAPSVNDLIVSKLLRLATKDKEYIIACHQARALNVPAIKRLLLFTQAECNARDAALEFLEQLPA